MGIFRTFLCFILLGATSAVQASYDQHSLVWPTHISESPHKLGPNLHQFQRFEESYFHEGLDILTSPEQSILTPVHGYVDAGYYSYTSLPNGLSEKKYISILDIDPNDQEPKLDGANYFEVSITDEFQNRFEFHHIDRKSLSQNFLNAIYNQETIPSGTLIGKVVQWPLKVRGVDYSHIHYSILTPSGVQQNPLWFSKKLKDTVPPSIQATYARLEQKCSFNGGDQYKELSQLNDSDLVTHIVLRTQDYLGENSFPHPPTKLTAAFGEGAQFSFDYSKYLFQDSLNSTPLKDLYATKKFCLGSPEFPLMLDSSTSFDFYIKIPVPEGYKGKVYISVSDFNDNSTALTITL